MRSLIIFLSTLALGWCYIVDPGPQVKATVGEVWPKPQYQVKTENYFILDPNNFSFKVIDNNCAILEKALERYSKIIKNSVNSPIKHDTEDHINSRNVVVRTLDEITVNLTSPCEIMPHLKMDEWYFLTGSGKILAHSIWGVLRGLESFSQLLTPYENELLQIPDIRIRDSPRFPHRGLLLDTSRHFISINTILKIIDGMAFNKLNVFHWHIVDDQAFPYRSIKFPELANGAYSSNMTYSQEDISNVIEYSRLRGIRVIAEFDVPGHTRSWGISHPEILTECQGPYEGKMGPIHPIKETSYVFLQEFFEEVIKVFPDKYVHLGGDEVGFECWSSNKEISQHVATKNITYTVLQRQFMERVTRFVHSDDNAPIVWQEAMVENVNVPKGTIVQVWTGNWRDLLRRFTEDGHQVLMSECWYLDHLATGGDWLKYYRCEPHDFSGSVQQKKLVIGGEACMWSEVVNDQNVIQRIFPRVSAAAERLWSSREITDSWDAQKRIEEHTCRLISRGIPAQPPNGPGFC